MQFRPVGLKPALEEAQRQLRGRSNEWNGAPVSHRLRIIAASLGSARCSRTGGNPASTNLTSSIIIAEIRP